MVWYNHLQPSPTTKTFQGVVISKGQNMKTGSRYIHLSFDGINQRFQLTKPTYNMLHEGDSVYVEIKKGGLGYTFLNKVYKKATASGL